jgi:hypothetical protein
MSVNAVALGALCCVAFWVWSFLAVLAVGHPDHRLAMTCAGLFDDSVVTWLRTGVVPSLPGVAGGDYRWVFAIQAVGAYAIWAIGGIAIARVMAVRIARDEYITLKEALAFAWSTKFTALLYAPAIAMSMLFLWVAIVGIGLIGQIPYFGWLVSALLLPVVVFFVILVRILAWAGVLSLGMTAGAIAVEKKGTWDSVAKAFNYLFARPLAVLLYVILLYVFVMIVEGILLNGSLLREHVASWLVPFGPSEVYPSIAKGAVQSVSGAQTFFAYLHAAVFKIVDALIAGAVLSWIIGAFTSMFLIFRKEVDGTDYTEIVRPPAA